MCTAPEINGQVGISQPGRSAYNGASAAVPDWPCDAHKGSLGASTAGIFICRVSPSYLGHFCSVQPLQQRLCALTPFACVDSQGLSAATDMNITMLHLRLEHGALQGSLHEGTVAAPGSMACAASDHHAQIVVQGAAAPDDFERALQDLRAKAATERAAAPPQRPSPAASAPSNGGVSAFSAFAAAAAMPSSSNSSNGSSARGTRGEAACANGAAAAPAGPGAGADTAPAAPTAVSPPFSPTQAAAAASAFTQQQPRPISGPKNYDLLLGD